MVLEAPVHARAAVNGRPDAVVEICPPGEFVLHAFGRGAHARATVDGPPASVTALESATVGL